MPTDGVLVSQTLWADVGVWLGFFLSLFLFSLLIRDNILARLAQHVLAGALIGYIALVAWQDALRPRLIAPLLNGENNALWWPAGLGALLLAAGLHRVLAQPTPPAMQTGAPRKRPLWQRALFNIGRLPAAILVGVGLAVGVVGALEGTFAPQYLRAAQIALDPNAPVGRIIIGLLTLVLTTGVMIHLYVNPDRLAGPQPGYVRQTLLAWMWIGRHALWVAAGILFARLLAARMSVLIAQVQRLVWTLGDNPIAAWLAGLFGG